MKKNGLTEKSIKQKNQLNGKLVKWKKLVKQKIQLDRRIWLNRK